MRGRIGIVLLVALALSGCFEGDEVGGDGDGGPQSGGPGGSTASIVGAVVREDFSPVEGARVQLIRDGSLLEDANTTETGRYRFAALDPGRYQLQVSATCCRPEATALSVEAGQESEVHIQLERLPPDVEEHVDVDGQWTGFVGCSIGGNLGALNNDCPDDNNDMSHEFPVDVGLRTIVVAMEWDQVVTSTTDRLRHWLYIQDPDDGETLESAVRINNVSAIEYRVDHSEEPSDEFEHDFNLFDEEFSMAFRVAAPRSPYLDVVYQQEFTVHWHLFYGEPAPEGHTALPDS